MSFKYSKSDRAEHASATNAGVSEYEDLKANPLADGLGEGITSKVSTGQFNEVNMPSLKEPTDYGVGSSTSTPRILSRPSLSN